jgi:acyl carrier protein
MQESIEKDIIAIISEISGYEEAEVTPDKNFYDDLEVDSIKAIEITVALEKRFKVSVRDEDVPKITTVKQAVEMVKTLLGQKP